MEHTSRKNWMFLSIVAAMAGLLVGPILVGNNTAVAATTKTVAGKGTGAITCSDGSLITDAEIQFDARQTDKSQTIPGSLKLKHLTLVSVTIIDTNDLYDGSIKSSSYNLRTDDLGGSICTPVDISYYSELH
jgi:hypothetical protein